MIPLEKSTLSLSISGNLTRANAASLEKSLKPLLKQQETDIVLDCSNLQSIDSNGIGMLFNFAGLLAKKGSALRLTEVNSVVYFLLRLTMLTDVIEVKTRKKSTQQTIFDRWAA